MGRPFASDRIARALCGRCGFQYPLKKLRPEVVDLNKTRLLVCPTCWDPDQPQLQLGRWPVDDPQALRNPRPDTGSSTSRDGLNDTYDFPTQEEIDTWSWINYDSAVLGNSATLIGPTSAGAFPNDRMRFTTNEHHFGNLGDISTSVQNVLVIRAKMDVMASYGVSWFGEVELLTTAPYPLPSPDFTVYAPEPIWNSMGDKSVDIVWDMRDAVGADPSGFNWMDIDAGLSEVTITLFKVTEVPTTKQKMTIDYVSFENWSDQS